jgi:GntR family transcriptional regulator
MRIKTYLQVKEDIIANILNGNYKPYDRLPSQRALAEEYGLSHMTIRRAINELKREGFIHAQQGRGLFVAEPKQEAELGPLLGFTEDMALRGMKASSQVLEAKIVNASTILAHTLKVVVGTPLVHLKRLRLADNEPMAIQSTYLPHALCPGLLKHNLETRSLFSVLRDDYALHLADSENAVSAELASAEEAELLKLIPPAALLVTEQITYIDGGQPIEYVRSQYRGDRYRMRIGREKTSPASI